MNFMTNDLVFVITLSLMLRWFKVRMDISCFQLHIMRSSTYYLFCWSVLSIFCTCSLCTRMLFNKVLLHHFFCLVHTLGILFLLSMFGLYFMELYCFLVERLLQDGEMCIRPWHIGGFAKNLNHSSWIMIFVKEFIQSG